MAFVALFLYVYETSHDPNRGMAFAIFIFVDPVAIPLFSFELSDAVAFAVLFIIGTTQWYLIGVLIRWIARCLWRLKKITWPRNRESVRGK